jgi:hypothetical protein
MADSSDVGAGIVGLLLLGLLGVAGLALAAAASSDRKNAPALPPPEEPRPPSPFLPIRGERRVIEGRQVVVSGGQPYNAQVYEPPLIPAPWTVRAWYEAHRSAHVIDVVAHPLLREPRALSVEVFVGNEHRADRAAFKRDKEPLWPDDKFENRVVHRVPKGMKDPCFLIDITANNHHLDFFHEPSVIDEFALDDPTPKAARRFAVLQELEELERAYAYEREKLVGRTDLSPAAKRLMEAHLIRLYEAGLREVTGSA